VSDGRSLPSRARPDLAIRAVGRLSRRWRIGSSRTYDRLIAVCSHLDQILIVAPTGPVRGCEECLKIGGEWVHLRLCETCGKIGCCDSSPHRHASAHAHVSGHPVVRSIEPCEDWSWCYVDEVMFRLAAP
jgi:hypothetical protein